jgi:hypothetical protein
MTPDQLLFKGEFMNRKTLIVSVLLSLLTLTTVAAITPPDLARLRNATASFHNLTLARNAGYDLVPGLDFCFDEPAVGGMGFHFIDTAELGNTTLNLQHPESLVFAPSPNGLQLGGVEYIVPQDLWDGAGNTQPPSLNGVPLHLEPSLGVYILHIWAWKNNPAGLFEDFNPAVPLCS